jgi:methylmalonyl-CoA/ethylmalonyl-CoA epimerase
MKLLGLDHVGIIVRNIDETVARAGATVDGRALGERFVSEGIDLQQLIAGKSILELIEVRNPGFGMPRLKDGEIAVIGHFAIEVDDLDDAKAELTRRGVALEGETDTDAVRFIFTVPQTTFGVTLQLMDYKGRRQGE